MPQVPISGENKTTDDTNFPKLKLEKDESARIVCIEPSANMEFVHTLRAPKMVNGVPQTKTTKTKDGSETTVYDFEFFGRYISFGDITVLQEKGLDPDNCPLSRAAMEFPDIFSAPERRFSMHVIRYAVTPGTTQPANPYGCHVLVWAYNDRTFNKLADLKEEWGNLQAHDLILGPCTNAVYQNFDISVAAQAVWLANDQVKTYTAQVYQANKAPDLSVFCGRKTQRSYVEQDIRKVIDRWEAVNAFETRQRGGAAPVPTDLLGVASALETTSPVDAQVQAALAGGDVLDAAMGLAPAAPIAPPAAPAAPVTPPAPVAAPPVAPAAPVAPPAPVAPAAPATATEADLLAMLDPTAAPVAPVPVAAVDPTVGGPFETPSGIAAPVVEAAPAAPVAAPAPVMADPVPSPVPAAVQAPPAAPAPAPVAQAEVVDFDSILGELGG